MAIHLPLAKLNQWQSIALSAALLERMLPNYRMFSAHASFGNSAILRNQLDLVWQWLDKNNRCKINYDAQLTKLEEQIPDPQAFDFFGVNPALDAAMALTSLLQAMQDKESDGFANVSLLSENSVSYYIQLCFLDEGIEDISEEMIEEHPLMEWEVATQFELFHFVKDAPENKQTCVELKSLALEEGLSNLGIEIA